MSQNVGRDGVVTTISDAEYGNPVSLDDLRQSIGADIESKLSVIMAAGAPATGELHVALDDSSRADMDGMATTAVAASTGAVPWPASYQQGWISIENTRIPLASPADGLALAASVGAYYAACRQHARDLKDAALAASDATTLQAIDISQGWPATS